MFRSTFRYAVLLFLGIIIIVQVRIFCQSSLQQSTRPCYKNVFKDTLLVMNFNYAFYGNNKILHELYDDVFGKVLTCGPAPDNPNSQGPDILYKEEKIWYFRYRCLTKAIRKYPGFKGYIYSNDDILINWWNLIQFDRTKIWQSGSVDWRQKAYGDVIRGSWVWWKSNMGVQACQKYYEQLKVLAASQPKQYKNYLNVYLQNGKGEPRCAKGWTDMFYVPGRFAQDYARLSDIAYENKLILEIAANNIIRTLDHVENFEYLNGTYLPDLKVRDISARNFWRHYSFSMTFIHPIKLNSKDGKEVSQKIIRNMVVHYKKLLLC